ncbi:MAG: hypothetical protein PHY43_14525 [Verrucomicrobiales bacterium]|nr:hypothetical protein [Verrucomicrobiales bacterium]
MRKIFRTIFGFWLCGLLAAAGADTFPLADGTSLTGDIISFNDAGVIFRLADNKYSDRVAWPKFSQDGLKQLANNPKIKPLVEPFIEIPLSERPQKPEVKINEVKGRLEVPPKQSLIGALFSSSVGIFLLLLIYAANIYAGYEIAIVRIRPKGLVMGVAAVLPVLGPIIFLAMPMRIEAAPAELQAETDPATFAVAGQPAPEEIHITGVTAGSRPSPSAGHIFQRGQFTFNRRFIETKFAGFFGKTRGAADENTLLILKTVRGQFVVERIARIAASEMHVEVALGETRQEVTVPFADIQEIQVKPKDA